MGPAYPAARAVRPLHTALVSSRRLGLIPLVSTDCKLLKKPFEATGEEGEVTDVVLTLDIKVRGRGGGRRRRQWAGGGYDGWGADGCVVLTDVWC